MSGQKIILKKMEYIKFNVSIRFSSLPGPQDIERIRSDRIEGWYPHYFNTPENLDYVGSIPDTSY